MSEGIDYRDDGTTIVEFDGGVIRTLRRPKLKQYRTLVESLTRMRRELLPDVDLNNVEEATKAAQNLDPNEQFDRLLAWLSTVFEALGDGPLPSEDELDSWIVNGEVTRRLVEQWTKVPTRRGGQ